MKFALNAGHGYNTPGKRCLKALDPNETREYILNKRICDKVQDILKEYSGIEILRIDDGSELSVSARAKKANAWKADYYIAVHHNAGLNGKQGGGIEVYTYLTVDQKTLDLQKAVYDSLIAHTGLKGNRSNPLRKADLGECRETAMPAVLIENGFMDSPADTPLILTEDYADKSAAAIAEVIIKMAGAKKAEESTPAPTPAPAPSTPKSGINTAVLEWQKAAMADGYKFPKYGADGKWGAECESVAKAAICKQRLTYTNKNLTKIIQKKVGVTADGLFGLKTKAAVREYQRSKGLTADGVVGINTWKKILGV